MSSAKLRRHRVFYKFAVTFFFLYYTIIFGLKIRGKVKSKDKPILFCINHRSFNDPPLIGSLLNFFGLGRDLYVLAKVDLFRIHPVFGKMLSILNAIPLQRNGMDADVIKRAVEVLESGNNLMIFPEGTRNKTKGLLEGKAGAGYIGLKSRAAVVPIYLKNTDEHPLKQILRIKRIEMIIGEEIELPDLPSNSKNSRKVTDMIMKEIGALEDV